MSQVDSYFSQDNLLPESHRLELLDAFLALKDDDLRKSHFFAGRFENIYVQADQCPPLAQLYEIAKNQAASWLGCEAASLRIGGWFNAMGPGHVTLAHAHEEDDEMLSLVYYIQVPRGSGVLRLMDVEPVEVVPQENRLLGFDPGIEHEVTENRSDALRLSVGMNVGPN